MTTISYSASAHQLVQLLGERLKQARLNKNITQEDLAQNLGVSRRTIINAEKGQVTLENLVKILQLLGLTSQLDNFLPPQPISPVQLLKLQGSKRQRATGQLEKNTSNTIRESSAW